MKDKIDWAKTPASQYPAFKGLERTGRLAKNGEQIYCDRKRKEYLHKDSMHGEVEVYDKKGDHKGVRTPEGKPHPKKGAVKGRTIRDCI